MRSVRGAMTTHRWLGALGAIVTVALIVTGVVRLMGLGARHADEVAEAKLAMRRLPLLFEANKGQAHGRVKFMSRGAGYNFFITPTASYLALARLPETSKFGDQAQRLPKRMAAAYLKMSLIGANPKARVAHEGPQRGRSNYFLGNDRDKWVTDVPSFDRIRCSNVYPGVDLVYYGNQQELEHDFILSPRTDPSTIKLEYAGARRVEVGSDGELLMDTGAGVVRQKRPIAYQVIGGRRQSVDAEYRLLADNRVAFQVGPYDSDRELVIDPVIRYSTYIGGSTDEYAFDIKLDANRNAYVTGYTGSFLQVANGEPNRIFASDLTPYPTANPLMSDPDRQFRDGFLETNTTETTLTYFDSSRYDAFVTRLNATGTNLTYSTYLGAEDDDFGMSIATSAGRVANQPYIYVTGVTESTFWPLQAAVQTRQGGRDAFAVKLDPSRSGVSQLVFSTYLGGSGEDTGRAIAVDGTQNVHIAGITSSPNLPTFSASGAPYQASLAGATDVFLVSLNASGSAYNYYTYFGGTGDERGLPASGTISDDFDYRVFNSPFVNAGGANPQSTALGGDITVALAADSQGFIYVAGGTTSNNLFSTFPPAAQNGAQPAYANGVDGFVAKFNPDGQPVYGTYLGGGGDDACRAIAINPQGQAYVTGYTTSGDFPTEAPATVPAPAFQSSIAGGVDAFVTKLSASGGALQYSTYLGGSGEDIGNGIAVSPSGQAYVAGITSSPFPTFPLVNPTQNDLRSSSRDLFISKLRPDGNEFEYSTYLGGSATDRAMAIAVDDVGQAYVTGNTESTDLPVSRFAWQRGQTGPITDTYVFRYAVSDVFVIQPHSPPFAPSNLIVTDINRDANNNHYVSLAWTDNSDNERGFEIERKLGDASSTSPWQVIGCVGPGCDTALNGAINSTQTNIPVLSAAGFRVNNFIQIEAEILQITAIAGNTLTATRGVLGSGAAAHADRTPVIAMTSGGITFRDQPLVPTTTYTYRVRPFNTADIDTVFTTFYGPYSNQLEVTTLPEPPDAPSSLTVTPIDTQRLKLDWTDTSTNEASLKIERRRVTPPSTSFTEIIVITSDATTGPGTGARTFTDDNAGIGLSANTTYEYRIRSSNVAGDSAYVGPVAGKTLPTAPSIAPVLGISGQTNSRIDLAWTYNNNDQVGFKIFRAAESAPGSGAAGPYTLIRTDTQKATNTQAPFDEIYTFSDPGLGANTTFFYRVMAYNQSGDGPSSNEASGTTLPDPPAPADDLDVTLVPGSTNSVRLEWDDNSQAPAEESGFKIEQSLTGSDPWTLVRTSLPNTGTGRLSETITGLQRNTVFYFRVIAFANNGAGDSDATPSNVDCAMTLPVDATNLQATTVSQTRIDLTWDDNNPAGTTSDFRIEQSTDQSSWPSIGDHGATPAGGQKSFSVTGLTPNTEYHFRVRAFNVAPAAENCDGGGDSPNAAGPVSRWTLPATPTGITVSNVVPTTNLFISFTDANAPASQSRHRVERSDGMGGWILVANLDPGTTSVIDDDNGNNLQGNRTYFYQVVATNDGGDSAPLTGSRLTLPAAAANFMVTVPIIGAPREGRTQLHLDWDDVSFAATDFLVERSTAGGPFVRLPSTVPAGTSEYRDTGLTENTEYCYRVIGTNDSGTGELSSTQCATTLKVPPTGPEGLTATVVSSSQINLAWTNTANNAEGIRIERKIGINGSYAPLAGAMSLLPDIDDYEDTGLTENTTYTYIVYAFNNGGDSAPSREAGGTTLQTPPAAPSGLTAEATSSSVVHLEWLDNATNETGFEVEVTPQGGSAAIRQVNKVSAGTGQTVTFDVTGLNANTSYDFRVRSRNNNISSWTGPASDLTFPANPSGLTASLVSGSRQVQLAWTDNNGANPSGNRIMRKQGSGMFLILTDRAAASGTTYLDDTVMAGQTYTYVIFAINTNGDLSSGSTNEATVVVPPDAPLAPTDLTAVAQSTTSILLTWTDRSDNETIFKIERSTDGVTFRQVTTKSPAMGVDSQVTHTDQGLVADTLYIYRVRAANGGGDSPYTDLAQARTFPNPPGAPSGLTATALSQTEIELKWSDGSSNENEFVIFRRNDAGMFVEHDTVAANDTNYIDDALTANTSYSYQVRARNGGGTSNASNTANATTHPNAPAAPSLFTAAGQSQNSIRLTWQDNSADEASFKLERSTDGTTWSAPIILGANLETYLDNGLAVDTIYHYRLVASNTGGDSPAVTTQGRTHPDPPSAPSSLTAVATGQTRVLLTWNDNSENETSFRIERRLTTGGGFSLAGTASAGEEQFTDTNGLVANTRYTYRVQAVNDGGTSSFSNEATVQTLPNPPAAPSNLRVTLPAGGAIAPAAAAGTTSLVLTWQDNSDNEDEFYIFRRTAGERFGVEANGRAAANATTHTDSSLSPQTTYFYVVVAINAGGGSAATQEASGTTLPSPPGTSPTGLQATPISSSSIRLNWTDAVDGETGFTIERKPAGGNFLAVGSAPPNATEYFDNGLAAATTYFYRVSAKNAGGNGDPSSEANATTLSDLPTTPQGVSVTTPPPTAGQSELKVEWSDSERESSYVIQRRKGAEAFVQAGTVNEGVTTFTDKNLVPGTTYIYRVIARNPSGESAPSSEAQGATLPSPPTAPSNLVVLVADATTLRLEWQDNSTDETGFRIERLVDGVFQEVNTTGANVKSTKVGGLGAGTVAKFRVIAFNNGGDSSPSNEAEGVTPGSGRLKVSRTKLNFGNVQLGSSATRSVRLSNIGNTPLMVSYTPVEAPFNVDEPQVVSLLIQPKASVDVTLTFTPSTRGRARSVLRITSTDPRRSRANVHLLGTSSAPRKRRR